MKNKKLITPEYNIVYEYIVCWREDNVFVNRWLVKYFACKKDAVDFAKKHIFKNVRPKPYIYKSITSRDTFKKEVWPKCERADEYDFNYHKFIKY